MTIGSLYLAYLPTRPGHIPDLVTGDKVITARVNWSLASHLLCHPKYTPEVQ